MSDKVTDHNIQALFNGNMDIILAANGVLSRIWRILLHDLGIQFMRWEAMLSDYCDYAKEHIPANKSANLKGNITKMLVKPDMSWSIFCRVVSVLKFKKFYFDIHTTDHDDSVEVLRIKIPFTLDENRGNILKAAWDELLDRYPDRVEHWTDYVDDFADEYQASLGSESGNLKSNLTRALTEEVMTWNTFYRGLMIMKFKQIRIEVQMVQRKKTIVTAIELARPEIKE